MTETGKELIRLLHLYIIESEDRMNQMSEQIKLLTIIDQSIGGKK